MENNKQYAIAIWQTNPEDSEKRSIVNIPVTKEVFDEYYRDINAFRRQQQRRGCCVCSEKNRLLCNMDCHRCPFFVAGDMSSLNEAIMDGEGNEIERLQDVVDEDQNIQTAIEEAELINELHKQIDVLPEEYKDICLLVMQGKSEREMSDVLGIPKTTVHRRKEEMLDVLRNALKNY